MREEKDREREERQAAHKAKLKKAEQKRQEIEAIHRSLCALFGATNPHERGKQLESVLNRLFEASGILVKEAFTLTDQSGSVVLEQIDGAVELDGHIYLVEMKWHKDPIGVDLVTPHISRLFLHGEARGIIISASNYTQPAIEACRGALAQKVVVLCDLQEIVMLLDAQGDLIQFIRTKANAAVTDKNPYHEIRTQRTA